MISPASIILRLLYNSGLLANRPIFKPFFSGSLYLLAMLGPDYAFIGAITPIGGTCFIIGWILLFASIYPKNFNQKS
jgi:uncharacterized membrane protein YgdD (TMEM256/DUF423 family)